MAKQISQYKKEIFNFLRTVTIKFEPFAYMMGKDYMELHGLTNPHAPWNPYYINLVGEYVESNTLMTVRAIETEQAVPFNRELFTKYPRTGKLYRIPNPEYFRLQERYPENTGLIQSIVYPVSSIEEAIAAPNLSLLAYDDSLLEETERYDLILCLKNFLEFVRRRWWVADFGYEDMYATTFWTMLWQMLPIVLLTRRFTNIRTPYVHSYHVWEYLSNKGLGDYRTALTTKQSMWLYRNLEYILKNQGKNDTLIKLAENLLEGLSVSLLYKEMWQETHTRMGNELITNPQFRSFNLLTGEWTKTEDYTSLNSKLFQTHLNDKSSPDYVNDTEIELGTQPNNILPTKFLEFKKNPIDERNLRMMQNFLLESLLYRIQHNLISYDCNFKSPLSESAFKVDAEDVLLLMNYAAFRSVNQTPEELPREYTYSYPFKESLSKRTSRSIFKFNNQAFTVEQFVNTSNMNKLIEWLDTVSVSSGEDNLTNLLHQFRALLHINNQYENSNDLLLHKALDIYLDDHRNTGKESLKWSGVTTKYDLWISNHKKFKSLIDEYDKYSEKDRVEAYRKLVVICYDALFPFEDLDPKEALYQPQATEKIFNAVKDLFISLGSYNVTYLETDRDEYWYLKYRDPDFVLNVETDFIYKDIFFIRDDTFKFDMHHKYDPFIDKIISDVSIDLNKTEINIDDFEINTDIKFESEYLWSHLMNLPERIEISPVRRNIDLTIDINLDPIS